MRALLALIKREFTGYFLSPVGYVTLFFFLVATGVLFGGVVDDLTRTGSQGVEYPFERLFGHWGFWVVFTFIPPLLTMRLLAEERGTGTLEALLTAPIRDWQVVAGKYIGAVLFYLVLWLPTLLYVPILLNLDWATWQPRIDPWPVLTSYLGVVLAGAMFLAVGLFVSSLVRSQLVAWMIALLLGLVFVLPALARWQFEPGTLGYSLAYYVAVPEHFRRDFTRGVIDTRPKVLYVTVTLCCLFLTVRSLEARRLR